MRGAGANFGVAVSFEFTAAHAGQLAFAQLVFDATDTAGFLNGWGAAIEAADRSVSAEIILGGRQGGRRYAQAPLVSTPTTRTRSSNGCSRSPASPRCLTTRSA